MKFPSNLKIPDAVSSKLGEFVGEDTMEKLGALTADQEAEQETAVGRPKPAGVTDEAPEPEGETATSSFKKAVGFLRANATDRNYRYVVPWFLVIGDPGSGKSSVMASAGTNLSENNGDFGKDELEWRFLPRGILLGVPGAYFGATKSRARDERGWPRLLRLLQSYRSRRPIDGIVLTIPAPHLTGGAALDPHQLSARANRFAEMLAQAQRTLGFSLPVYVLVTKSDCIPGFREFAHELPTRSGDEIFGWSSPYNLDFSFAPKWVDEAFDSLLGDVHGLQNEIFAESSGLAHRDASFLFPGELEKTREPMRLFLERMFQETVYRESFKLRGLYFCGDVSELPREAAGISGVREKPLDEWPAEALIEMARESGRRRAEEPRPEPAAKLKSPAFLKNLFEQKIFPEGGIAAPLSRVAMVKNRTVLAIQAAAVVLALVLGTGTALSYQRLVKDRDKVLLMLDVMKRMPQTPQRERHNLLTRMVPAGNANLKSGFLPASLFSPTDGDITKVMTFACNKWVLETLRGGLHQRAQRVLERELNAPDAAPADPNAPALAENEQEAVTNVEQLPDYRQLEKYVSELMALEDNIDAYEAIRQRGQVQDIERIRKLVQYLYTASVDELRADGHLAAALSSADGLPFTPSAEDKIRATELMRAMIQQLFEAWFTNSLLLSDTEDIKAKIGDLEFGKAAGQEALRSILAALKVAEEDFGSPGFKWVNSTSLDLNGPFRRVILAPLTTPQNRYLNPDLLDFSKRLGEDHLRRLRDALSAESVGVTGPLLDVKETIGLSAEAKNLRLLLENTMNLPFMGVTGGRAIRTRLDPGLRLMWRPEPLQDVLRLHDLYARYAAEALTGTRDRMRETLSRVALDQLRRTADDRISQAQDFQGRPLSGRSALSQEDETLPEVNSFREVVVPLTEIATKFKRLGLVDTYAAVVKVLGNQAWEILSLLDRRLEDENPYKGKDSNFDAWNGRDPITAVAFEAQNQQELGNYLDTQRERIKVLAQQADPLVQFLNTWYPTRGEEQNRMVSRWQGMIGDFQQYEARKPGASLAALQDFILNDMDKITPDTDCLGGGPRENRTAKTDYFTLVRARLRQGLMDRCRSLTSTAGQQSYMEIATLFNQKLAGNFPFAALAGPGQPEASPEDVLEFYKALDRNEKVARATLNAARTGPQPAAALQFLDQMERLRPLVANPSPDAEKEPPFTLDFTPRLRVNRPREIGGNQTIDWTMQVGGQLFHLHDPDHPGRWRYGNPVRISLRWANDSIYVPVPDPTQPNLRVVNRTVIYEFTNKWAMLSLLRRQEAPPSDGTGSTADTLPYLLRLRIRTGFDPTWARTDSDAAPQSAVVYIQARVSAPGGGAKGGIVLPPFPVKAPVIAGAPTRRAE